jgi:hypothetical protein
MAAPQKWTLPATLFEIGQKPELSRISEEFKRGNGSPVRTVLTEDTSTENGGFSLPLSQPGNNLKVELVKH